MTIKIYVGNLSYNTTETELNDLFAQFGEVGSTKIISDRYSGRSRGFAFVEMSNRDEGQSAINELNGSEVRGRNLKVSEARPKKNDRGMVAAVLMAAGKTASALWDYGKEDNKGSYT